MIPATGLTGSLGASGMDLLEAKSRIAEALVESIFRRARYQVEPFPAGRTPLRFGREDFSPNFRATIPGEYGESSSDILIEVKYRPSVEQFISVENQRGVLAKQEAVGHPGDVIANHAVPRLAMRLLGIKRRHGFRAVKEKSEKMVQGQGRAFALLGQLGQGIETRVQEGL